jgi:hypothetical protein
LRLQWKDRSADGPVSAKKPRKVKERQKGEKMAREDIRKEALSEEDGRKDGDQ